MLGSLWALQWALQWALLAVLGASGLHDLALCAAVEDAHLLARAGAEREEALRLAAVASRDSAAKMLCPAWMHPSLVGRLVLARTELCSGTQKAKRVGPTCACFVHVRLVAGKQLVEPFMAQLLQEPLDVWTSQPAPPYEHHHDSTDLTAWLSGLGDL